MTKKELEADLVHKSKIIEKFEEHLNDLNRYLNSSKFDIDTTVQVRDISLRLTELRLELSRV